MKMIYLTVLLIVLNIGLINAQERPKTIDPQTGRISNYSHRIDFRYFCLMDIDTDIAYDHANYNSIIGWEINEKGVGRLYIASYNNNQTTKHIFTIESCTQYIRKNGEYYFYFLLINKNNVRIQAQLNANGKKQVKNFMVWNSDNISSVFYN